MSTELESYQNQLDKFNKAMPGVESTRDALMGLNSPDSRYNLSTILDPLELVEKAKRNVSVVGKINTKTLPFLQDRIESLEQSVANIQIQENKAKLAQGIIDLEEAVSNGFSSSEVLQRARELAGFTESITDVVSIEIPGEINFQAAEEKPEKSEYQKSKEETLLEKFPPVQRKIMEGLLTGSEEKPITREQLAQFVYAEEIKQGKYSPAKAKNTVNVYLVQQIEKKILGLHLSLKRVKMQIPDSKHTTVGYYLTETTDLIVIDQKDETAQLPAEEDTKLRTPLTLEEATIFSALLENHHGTEISFASGDVMNFKLDAETLQACEEAEKSYFGNISEEEKIELLASKREAVLAKIEDYFNREGGLEEILDSYPDCTEAIKDLLISAYFEFDKLRYCFFLFLKADLNGEYQLNLHGAVIKSRKIWKCPYKSLPDKTEKTGIVATNDDIISLQSVKSGDIEPHLHIVHLEEDTTPVMDIPLEDIVLPEEQPTVEPQEKKSKLKSIEKMDPEIRSKVGQYLQVIERLTNNKPKRGEELQYIFGDLHITAPKISDIIRMVEKGIVKTILGGKYGEFEPKEIAIMLYVQSRKKGANLNKKLITQLGKIVDEEISKRNK